LIPLVLQRKLASRDDNQGVQVSTPSKKPFLLLLKNSLQLADHPYHNAS
jgi:hypothetical protein